ncbi:YggS family pyridoxal phosphate-dependent enzyme [Luteolibacter pohnpeiensis]|uniref:Pyridoxal phosphate homeostasis protein n=1 Tax=Luteolibacter pohnpeiensis TaxID=454153 RepID=A0A934S5L4_9BACT|nr:YggS family pyridoxal phosphate-dependent enzyme [Luteolibacter pohnpeiensis]MBK1881594.1 YggS family pyridoxal phosphate-dependent enzyme [Luteolibacter pohnpeiensis]
MSDGLPARLNEVKQRISAACRIAGRAADSVQLVAVSKTFPSELIREAYDAGQLTFGESRQQEAQPKIDSLPEEIDWHFIGRVQRNKVRKILSSFSTIHAIDSLKLADFTSSVSKDLGVVPNVFLQVNVGGEESKGGFEPDELDREAESVFAIEGIQICGLMTVPPASEQKEQSRKWFSQLRDIRDGLEAKFAVTLPYLSMGMSSDYEVAIEEGATHVRVGSAIFGGRSYHVDGELGAR